MKGASRTALPALALVASLLVAQTSERPPEPPTGSIRGRVVSSTDGTPIRGAVVSIENAQPVLAGAKGRFLMEGAPSGSQVVLAYKSGYRRHQGRVAVPAEDETEIEISLLPFAAVAGKIMGPEGEPLQGHTVAAYADRGRMNRPARSKDRQSDDHGRYRLFGLVGGRYWFVVEAKPLPGVAGRTSYVFLPAFYPNTTNPAEAYPMEIRSGAKFEGLDFRLREAPATLFRGEVEMADTRAPCGNCPFTLYRRSGEIYWRVGTHNTAPNGSFAIAGLAPGLYTLAGAPIFAGHVGIAFVPLEEGASNRVQGVVPPGSFSVRVNNPPFDAYLKTVRVRGRPIPTAEVHVPAYFGHETIEVVLAFDGATVSGTVAELGGRAGTVRLFPEEPKGYRRVLYGSTNEQGAFRINAVPPGKYQLFAVPKSGNYELQDAVIRRRYERWAKKLDLKANDQASIELQVLP